MQRGKGKMIVAWCLAVVAAASVVAQEPRGQRGRNRDDAPGAGEDQEGRGGRGGRMGGGRFGGGFPNPLFEALDADGDQEISEAELRRAAANLKKLDRDGDGRITQEELRPTGTQMADRMFSQFDQNGDGQITPDEAPQGPGGQMLANADEDGDGAISKQELAKAMEQFGGRFRGMGGGPGGPGGFAGGPGGGDPQQMMGRFMQSDANGDGKLSPDEVPQQMMGMLRGGDLDQDGFIDARELQAIIRQGGGRFRGPGGPGGPGGDDGAAPQGRGRRSYERFQDQDQ